MTRMAHHGRIWFGDRRQIGAKCSTLNRHTPEWVFFRFSDIPQRICARKITKANAFNIRNSAGKPQDHKILLLQASVDDLPVKLTVSDRATGKCNDRILEGKHQNQVRETILKLENSITMYHQARRKLRDSPSEQPGLRAVSVTIGWMYPIPCLQMSLCIVRPL